MNSATAPIWEVFQRSLPGISIILVAVFCFIVGILIWKNITYVTWAWITAVWIRVSKSPAAVGDILRIDGNEFLVHKISNTRVELYRITYRDSSTTTIANECVRIPVLKFAGMTIVNLGNWL